MVVETYLFSAAGGFAIGVISGYALKRIIKLAAIILGTFFLGLVYLSYRGWISVNWSTVQSQTYSGLMNATQTAQRYLESTANHLASNPHLMDGQGMTIAAGVGFLPGILFGLRH